MDDIDDYPDHVHEPDDEWAQRDGLRASLMWRIPVAVALTGLPLGLSASRSFRTTGIMTMDGKQYTTSGGGGSRGGSLFELPTLSADMLEATGTYSAATPHVYILGVALLVWAWCAASCVRASGGPAIAPLVVSLSGTAVSTYLFWWALPGTM